MKSIWYVANVHQSSPSTIQQHLRSCWGALYNDPPKREIGMQYTEDCIENIHSTWAPSHHTWWLQWAMTLLIMWWYLQDSNPCTGEIQSIVALLMSVYGVDQQYVHGIAVVCMVKLDWSPYIHMLLHNPCSPIRFKYIIHCRCQVMHTEIRAIHYHENNSYIIHTLWYWFNLIFFIRRHDVIIAPGWAVKPDVHGHPKL